MINSYVVYTFYRFLKIRNKKYIKKKFDTYLSNITLKGTILIANEGINVSIAGEKEEVFNFIKQIKKELKIRKIQTKINYTNFIPFNRMKVRIKKEIVSLGMGDLDTSKYTGKNIHPSEWNKIISKKKVKLIDTRNIYEINIGKFINSINPNTNNFREFPKKLLKMNLNKEDAVAMYCTGGIRCEKASAYLKLNGFKNVMQLEGGIINYLDYMNKKKDKSKSKWQGECFVFDNRVTINKKLSKGKFVQCFGCRNPITMKDTKLKSYVKGVSCKYCYNKRSKLQKRKSISRQLQIELARNNAQNYI
tara:strand:- start:1831 stop:2745 length:915 start_codon:yes stop_codon:yes gene_type:complete